MDHPHADSILTSTRTSCPASRTIAGGSPTRYNVRPKNQRETAQLSLLLHGYEARAPDTCLAFQANLNFPPGHLLHAGGIALAARLTGQNDGLDPGRKGDARRARRIETV